MKRLSARFHLALGLSSIVVCTLLVAIIAGLVPNREDAVRQGRMALAESVAISSATLADAGEQERLVEMLRFIAKRNESVQSIGLRRADGVLVLATGEHGSPAEWTQEAASTESHLRVPLLREGGKWGQLELRFKAGDSGAWLGGGFWGTALLISSVGAACFAFFYLYLRRMLRHLDPSRVVPGRVRTAFDTLAEGLLVLDPKGRIVLANRAFAELLGQDADSMVGKLINGLPWVAANENETRGISPWESLLADGQPRRDVLMHLKDAAGARRSFMVNCSPVPGADGKPAGVLVSLDDVTALEEKELQLRIARDQAEAANRAKSDFLANMSHEIRTPMNAILGFAELLRRGWGSDAGSAQRHLDTIVGSGKHLLALINDILDLSKVEAGRLEVERVPTAVHEVVHEVADIMRVRGQEKGVAVHVVLPEALPATIQTDPSRLRQIVTNLVGNALKFTQHGAVTLTVRMSEPGSAGPVVIDVTDTGIGIPADKLEAIFEAFVQAEASTTRNYGGTGLGLSISRRFARALGGDVVASSVPGQGSTFRITLDTGDLAGVRWCSPAELAAREAAVGPQADDGMRWQFPPKRVLVVDDGNENRELVRLVLESAGLSVLEATNGQEALDVMARERVSVVLMDVQMPVMDGYTATRRLREMGHTLPIYALTAHAMKGHEAPILEAGFTAHLTKPIDIDRLLGTLAGPLEGQRVAQAAAPAPAAAGAMTVSAPAPAPAPAATASTAANASSAPEDQGPIASRLAHHPKLAKVARNFALTLPAKLDEMDAALDAADWATLAHLAHWLKGAGGTVGYDALFEPARDLEQQVKAAQAEPSRALLQRLRGMSGRLQLPVIAEAAPPAAATAVDAATAAN